MTYTQEDFERDCYRITDTAEGGKAYRRLIDAYSDLVSEVEWLRAVADVRRQDRLRANQMRDHWKARAEAAEKVVEAAQEFLYNSCVVAIALDAALAVWEGLRANPNDGGSVVREATPDALSSDAPIVPLTGAMHANADSVTVQDSHGNFSSQLTSEVTSAACEEDAE